jgi:hypothetical protein
MRFANVLILEETMSATSRALSFGRCAFCGEPLVSNAIGVVAWREGNRFVCNEFCADGVSTDQMSVREDRADTAKLTELLPRLR